MLYYLAPCIAVLGSLTYHLAMKQAPANLNPFFALSVAYALALVFCLIGLALHPEGSRALRDLRPSIGFVALGVLFAEVGFLLAYRTGWNVGYASLLVNTSGALLLLLFAIYWFKEGVSATKLSGAALCLAGLALLVRK